MSSTPFGEHLKRERELRGVSLEEIAAATRINTRYLEALESEHWSELPGGAFNRGFIRSVARFLGLDEDDLIAEYSLETKSATGAPAAAEKSEQMPRNWKPVIAAIALLVLLVACAFAGVKYYRTKRLARQKQTNALRLSGVTTRMPFESVVAIGAFGWGDTRLGVND